LLLSSAECFPIFETHLAGQCGAHEPAYAAPHQQLKGLLRDEQRACKHIQQQGVNASYAAAMCSTSAVSGLCLLIAPKRILIDDLLLTLGSFCDNNADENTKHMKMMSSRLQQISDARAPHLLRRCCS
jgi:hypothetical protein